MIVNMGTAFKAFITVTYPSGTCTLSHESGASYTHSGGGTHTFVVRRRGKWNIRAEDGTMVKEASAEISARGQIKTVVLSYELVLFDRSLASDYSLNGNYISPAIDLSQYSTIEVTASFWASSGSLYVGVCTNPSNVGIGNPASAYIAFESILNQYQTKTLNISAINSDMYIGFWSNHWTSLGDFSVSDGEISLYKQGLIIRISKIVLR